MTEFIDLMKFNNKPDLGMKSSMSFLYEWGASLKDDKGTHKSSYTIEYDSFIREVQKRNKHEYIVIDIESFDIYHDPIAIEYVRTAKTAAPNSKIGWWNLGPRTAWPINADKKYRNDWSAIFDKRKALVDEVDFCIMAGYFTRKTMTAENWERENWARIPEARRLFKDKPIMMTLSPHPFFKGRPWQMADQELLESAIDICAEAQVNYIPIWSNEGSANIQDWDENSGLAKALKTRSDNGSYVRSITL